jgi:hypothetical protein
LDSSFCGKPFSFGGGLLGGGFGSFGGSFRGGSLGFGFLFVFAASRESKGY